MSWSYVILITAVTVVTALGIVFPCNLGCCVAGVNRMQGRS